MERPNVGFILMDIVLLFVAVGLIIAVFNLQSYVFAFELGVLLVFLFLLVFAMLAVYQNRRWGWAIVGTTLILVIANTFFMIWLRGVITTSHMVIIFFSVVGLIITFLNLIDWGRKYLPVATAEQDVLSYGYDKENYYYPYVEKAEAKQEMAQPKHDEPKFELQKEEVKAQANVEKTFTPGKYVASKNASKFHIPKCVWANNINKENQVWFDSKEEAVAKGFSEHKCDIITITTVKS